MPKTTFWKLLSDENRHIVIPVNQREYAQGRRNREADEIRANFVALLHNGLGDGQPVYLDLIYGSIKNGNFIPFDGQQRLTTLFLLHWLLALRSDNLTDETRRLLHSFQYELREETEKFCCKLIDQFKLPEGSTGKAENVATVIRDSSWYDAKWDRDPSIRGMLTMLQALDNAFTGGEYKKLWERLVGSDIINFFYEEIAELGTTEEELYIKMNSRGKELTYFERYKPRLLGYIKDNYTEEIYRYFCEKLDGAWLDFFWINFGSEARDGDKAKITDFCFFNFLWFLFDMLRQLPSPNQRNVNVMELEPVAGLYELTRQALDPEKIFWPGHDNLEFLKIVLDKLSSYNGSAENLFNEYFYGAGTEGMPHPYRISWYESNCNLLAHICQKPAESTPRRQMLLGFLLWLASGQTDKSRLRHLRNLILNSEDEFRSDPSRAASGQQLLGMSALVLNGLSGIETDEKLKAIYQDSGYNRRQLKEERAKYDWLENISSFEKKIIWLENHPFLRGNLTIAYVANEPSFDATTMELIYSFFMLCFNQEKLGWETMIRSLLTTGAFDWWAAIEDPLCWSSLSLRLYNETTIDRRQIFICQNPVGRASFSRKSVKKIAGYIKSCNTVPEAEEKLTDKLKDWLATKSENRQRDWIWYFVMYPEMLAASRNTQGYYYWFRSHCSFLQTELDHTTARSNNCNPFLWTVWRKAGFKENEIKGLSLVQNSGVDRINYIHFPCKLTLWPGEFGWIVLTEHGQKPKRDTFRRLRANFRNITDNGYLYISGLNMVDKKETDKAGNWKNELTREPDWSSWRIYDYSDRIELGVKLATVLLEI